MWIMWIKAGQDGGLREKSTFMPIGKKRKIHIPNVYKNCLWNVDNVDNLVHK